MIPFSVVISVFAIVILSVLGLFFRANHHELVGGDEDPQNGPEVAATVFVSVLIYVVSIFFGAFRGILNACGMSSPLRHITLFAIGPLEHSTNSFMMQGFLIFCGLQGVLHMRESRRGAIAL